MQSAWGAYREAVDAAVLNHASPVDPGVQRIKVTIKNPLLHVGHARDARGLHAGVS